MEGMEVVEISPFECRLWKYHDRLPEYVNEASCNEEISSISRHGQQQPVLGRRVRGDPECSVEIIFGSRRLFACRHLGIPIRVQLREITDREALLAMDVENRLRRDVSPYERGMSYVQWLRDGVFRNQRELAMVLNVSIAQVCRLIKFAEIPAVIINGFPSPLEIKESWALTLVERLAVPELRSKMIATARNISRRGRAATALEVYEEILGAVPRPREPKRAGKTEIVLSNEGVTLFKVLHRVGNMHIVIPSGAVDMSLTEQLKEMVRLALLERSVSAHRASAVATRGTSVNEPNSVMQQAAV